MTKKDIAKKIKYSLRFLPDKLYLQMYFFARFHKFINFNDPKTYNEKLNWLKINDKNDDYSKMVDKYDAKNYVKSIIGEKYIIPTLGIWDDVDDIEFDKLPQQFVLKCTHDSESVIVVKNKDDSDINEIKKELKKSMKYNYYYISREWPYKNIKPRIIAEKYMQQDSYNELRDYKFMCFDGEMKCLYISDFSHTKYQKIAFFDSNYNYMDIKRKDYGSYEVLPEQPKCFEEMKKLAEKLSKGFNHIRVDFYEIEGKVFFGELTFYTCSGFVPFEQKKWDLLLGDFLNINKKD